MPQPWVSPTLCLGERLRAMVPRKGGLRPGCPSAKPPVAPTSSDARDLLLTWLPHLPSPGSPHPAPHPAPHTWQGADATIQVQARRRPIVPTAATSAGLLSCSCLSPSALSSMLPLTILTATPALMTQPLRP